MVKITRRDKEGYAKIRTINDTMKNHMSKSITICTKADN